MNRQKTFHSNGKLLLTGEYFVLDGTRALAIPTTYGQSLEVMPVPEQKLYWQSYGYDGWLWLEAEWKLDEGVLKLSSRPGDIVNKLYQALCEAARLNSAFLKSPGGFQVTTRLDFDRNWGLGSSSTLINNIAQWAGVNAFELLQKTFGGSGYDVACARHDRPIVYSNSGTTPTIEDVSLNWPFKDQLWFVYLGKKQDSREGIAEYRSVDEDKTPYIRKVNELTDAFINCKTLGEFDHLVGEHEQTVSKLLSLPTVKSTHFPDFPGAVKSLGAWGGDFVLATGNKDTPGYFQRKGYRTVIPFDKMVK